MSKYGGIPDVLASLIDGIFDSTNNIVKLRMNATRAPGMTIHRNAVTSVDKLASTGTLTLTAITEGGSTLANVAYHVLVSAGNRWGNAPVGADPGAITPTASQAVRLAFAAVTNAEWYDIFLSTATNPLWLGRITEAQRAAGGFIISAVGVTSAGGGAGAGAVDLGIVGTGLASNVNPFLVNNAYVPNLGSLTPVSCAGYAIANLHVKLAVTDLRSLPTLVIIPFFQDQTSGTDWFMGSPVTMNILTAIQQPLEQNIRVTVDGATAMAVLIDTISGQGAAASIWVELT